MKLSWSHVVMYVRDKDKMVDFYTEVLGFQVTDRDKLAKDGPEIIFMSQDPEEHHQLGMVDSKQNDDAPNTVSHFAFRVENFEDVQQLNRRLEPLDGIKMTPLSHGNTLSIYFNDPEGNGIEVFWDTPWHVGQPQGKAWDPSLDKKQALAWVEAEFKNERGFGPKQDYATRRRRELADRS